MSVLKRLLFNEKEVKAAKEVLTKHQLDNTKAQTEPEVEVMKEYQEFNPFTELLFLEGHSDIVRLLVKIDGNRCVSAADDNLAIIWDIQLGYKLVVLSGHSRPITDMVVIPPKGEHPQQLLTGSSDKQIRMWDIDTGDCVKVLTEHAASVRCLLVISSGCQFCSGGQGLFLWYRDGHLATSYQLEGEENDVCFMIALRNDRIVAAIDKQLIHKKSVVLMAFTEKNVKSFSTTKAHKNGSVFLYIVYTVTQPECQENRNDQKMELVKKLSPHREAVRSLVNITENTFASGSIDGTIILWKTDNLLPFRYFNSIPEYEGPHKTFPYSVQYMTCVESRYIIAAVGSGFCLYDADTGRTMIHKVNAHFSKLSSLVFVCSGLFLATASTDGSIRLWGYRHVLRNATTSDSLNGKGIMHTFTGRQCEDLKSVDHNQLEPQLLGECLAHSGAVQCMIDCDSESLVSSGVDHLVIVWRNENIQMMKRSHVLQTQMSVDGIV